MRASVSTRLVVAAAIAATVTVLGMGSAAATSKTTATAKTTATKTILATVHPLAGVRTTLTATVSPKPTGGTVKFSVNGATIGSCSAAAVGTSTGKATCTTTFTSTGARTVTAAYSGKSPYAASSGKATITVAAASGKIVGGVGSCTTSAGALVAVSFGPWTGPIVRGCDPNPTTGIKLLTTAGFTTAGDQHDGPAFICRIGHPVFNNGTQYPTSSQDPCFSTPPASALWTYWLGQPGANTWTYSAAGAYSDKPKPGEVEAWVYGASTVQPTFTPDQIRTQAAAGTVSASPVGSASGQASVPAVPAAKRVAQRPAAAPGDRGATAPDAKHGASTAGRAAVAAASATGPDVPAAVKYLTGPSTLVGGTHYDPFGFGADIGLTIDGAFALAATGTADPTLAKITDYVAAHADPTFTFFGTEYAGGGSIGKEALLAEITGHDPRAFGGHDLIAALDGLVCTDSAAPACAGPGNYSYAPSVFSQSLGIIAQLRADDAAGAAKPIAYLESLQNGDGSFPSVLPGTGSEVDSTAMAAMALDLLTDDATAQAAVDNAVKWIAGQQEQDGGFPGASGDSTNSAALALQGLKLAGSTYAGQIDDTLAFLARHQNSDGGFNVTSDDQSGSDVRATTQVVGGIVGTSFGTLFDDITAVVAPPDPSSSAPSSSPSSSPATRPASSTPRPASSTSAITASVADPSVAAVGNTTTLASTGVHSATLIAVAVLLAAAGLLLWFAGRRPRALMASGRHRGRSR